MDRIFYAGDSVLTGTAIAEALLDYAAALAQVEASATIDIPTRLPDGSVARSKFLVGPASQLVSETEPDDGEELRDDALVARLEELTRRTVQTRSTVAVPQPEPVVDPLPWRDEI